MAVYTYVFFIFPYIYLFYTSHHKIKTAEFVLSHLAMNYCLWGHKRDLGNSLKNN